MSHTMFSFNGNGINNHFMSDEEIISVCPNAFKTTPTNPNVSDKYVHASTIDVIRDMRNLGWYPVAAKQCRNKKGSKGIRSFHMICFQNPNIKVMSGDEIEAYPRIILQNSHDGFNSFKFMVGLYRCICSNGLIIADAEYDKLSIRHINYTFDELKNIIKVAVEKLPNKIECINKMKSIELSDDEKESFVESAVRLRKGLNDEEKYEISKEEILDILNPVREEDKGNSLWATFNVIQEKLINGGYYLSNGKKSRKQRGIKSVKKDVEINLGLYNIANAFVAKYNV